MTKPLGTSSPRACQACGSTVAAELEIRQLHQKVDPVLSHQWQRLIEIQKIQIELIHEVRALG